MSKYNPDTGDFKLDSALSRLTAEGWGTNWSVSEKNKTLIKFGRAQNLQLNVRSTLWGVGAANETYLEPDDGNLITHAVSTSDDDIGHVIDYEGQRYDGDGNMIFTTGRVTLNGLTPVALAVPLCRHTRATDDDAFPLVGDVRFYQGVGATVTLGVVSPVSLVHNIIKGSLGFQQTYKGASGLSYVDAFLITALTFSINRKQAATVDFALELARFTNVAGRTPRGFRPLFGEESLNSAGQSALRLELDPVIIIPPNHDFKATATSSASGVEANCTISGYLAVRRLPL